VTGTDTAQPVSARRSLSRRGWLAWLTLVACLPPLGLNLIIPLDLALAGALKLDPVARMGSIGLYALGLAVGQPLAGIAADRYGRRPTLLAGLATGVAGGLISCLAIDATGLLAGRTLSGLGFSCALVVPRAVLRDLVSGVALQRGMATISGAFALTPAAAPVLAWWLHGFADWRGVLALLPCLGAVALIAALLIQIETRPAATLPPGFQGAVALWQHRPSRWLALAFAAIGSLFFVMIAVVPQSLRDTLGIDDRGVALIMGGSYLGFLAGNLLVAASARRFTSLAACGLGAGLAAAGVVAMALCTLVPSGALWTVGLLAYSTGHGLIFPAVLGQIMQAMPTRAGMAAAVTGMMPMIAGAALCLVAALIPAPSATRLALVAMPMILLGIAALGAAWCDMRKEKGDRR
jgi:DHA1 family bicyclomycin/chloramphenicol resistance-like MFS transporter